MRKNGRPKLTKKLKLALLKEAGGKCANPGCPNTLVEFHHINEWHICRTHNQKDMIAVCPMCHAHIHRGRLRIDDQTIRRWKAIDRQDATTGALWTEPADSCRLLLGSIYVTNTDTTSEGITVFRLSRSSRLSLGIRDRSLLLLDVACCKATGEEIFRVTSNYVNHVDDGACRLETRQGLCRLSVPFTNSYLPTTILDLYQQQNPPEPLDVNGYAILFEAEVILPGTVQIKGLWFDEDRAVVITESGLSICDPEKGGFVHILGYGDVRGAPRDLERLPLIRFEGPIDSSLLSAWTTKGF